MTRAVERRPAPFKGLVPYSEEDASLFFGRQAECEIVAANLIARRLTVLYAESGVGKSSILQAGVAHRLRQEQRQGLDQSQAPEFIVVVFSSWRDDPLAKVIEHVADAVASALGEDDLRASASAGSLVEALQAWGTKTDSDLLVILDQFEEYFLYHPHEDGEGTFATEFPRAVNDPDLRVNFLISIREDSLAKLDRFKGRIPGLFDNYLRIERLDREAARSAIEGPIEEYNRVMAGSGDPIRIEPELVDSVLAQVRSGRVVLGDAGRGALAAATGSDPAEARIEAPYLQLVMSRLWEEETRPGGKVLRCETLNRLGGAERVVRTHLDSTMGALLAEDREAAASIFHHLVTPSGTKIAHTAVDLAGYSGLPASRLITLLEKLSGSKIRILRPVAPPSEQPAAPRYQIFHDVLAAAVLDWRQRYVLEQEREREARRAEERQRRAEEKARADERAHQADRRRWLSIALAVVVVALCGITVFAVISQRHARDLERARDGERAAVSRGLAGEAERNLEVDAELGALLALEAVAATHAHGKPPTAEAQSVLQRAVQEMRVQRTVSGHPAAVSRVAFSPDGDLLATAGYDHSAKLWDLENGDEILQFSGHGNPVHGIAFRPDGRRLATSSADGTVIVWDLDSGRKVVTLATTPEGRLGLELQPTAGAGTEAEQTAPLPTAAESARASGAEAGAAHDLAAAEPARPEAAGAKVSEVFPGSPGARAGIEPGDLIVGIGGKEVDEPQALRRLVDELPMGETELELMRQHEPVTVSVNLGFQRPWIHGIAFGGPDGKRLAAGDQEGTVEIWDVESQRSLSRLYGHTGPVLSVTYREDGERLATASSDGAKVWETASGREALSLTALRGFLGVLFVKLPDETAESLGLAAGYGTLVTEVIAGEPAKAAGILENDVIVGIDGKEVDLDGLSREIKLLAAGSEAEIKLLREERTLTVQVTLGEGPVPFYGIAFSPDGSRLATVDEIGHTRIWDAESGNELRAWPSHADRAVSVTFSADGLRLATASRDGETKVWDAANGTQILNLVDDGLSGQTVAFSPSDSEYIATANDDGKARLWTASGEPVLTLDAHYHEVWGVAYNPDGTRLATAGRDNKARIWDVATGEELLTLAGHTDRLFKTRFSPDGRYLATTSRDDTARLWDAETGAELTVFRGHTDTLVDVAFDSEGKLLATASLDKTARIWDLATGETVATLSSHGDFVWGLAFSPDGSRLATAGQDRTVRVWEAATGKQLKVLEDLDEQLYAVAFSPDGARLAAAGEKAAKVWDTSNGDQTLTTLRGHTATIWDVAFSPDSQYLVTASADQTAKVWDPGSGEEVATYAGHTGAVFAVDWSPDGRQLTTVSGDGTLRTWDALRAQREQVRGVAFSPGGSRLAVARNGGTARVWDLANDQAWLTLSGHTSDVLSIAFSPDGKRILTASADLTAKLWDAVSGEEIVSITEPKEYAHFATFDPTGEQMATGSEDGVARIWNLETGQEVLALAGHTKGVWGVAFSPDGKRIATSSADRSAKIWDTETGQESFTLAGHDGAVYSVDWSPDGNRVATASLDTTVRLWDPASGEAVATIPGHTNTVTGVRFDADGKRIVTASLDNTVRIWDAESGLELRKFGGHPAGVNDVALSPNGLRLASASRDGQFRIFTLDAEDLVAEAYERVTRSLTATECRRHTPRDRCGPTAASVGLVVAAKKLAAAGEVESAAATLQKALSLNPGLPLVPRQTTAKWAATAHVSKGRLLLRAGEVDGASESFLHARQLDPGLELDLGSEWSANASRLVATADGWVAEGRADEAIHLLKKTVGMVDGHGPPVQLLVRLYKAEQKYDQAIETLENVAGREASPWVHGELADAYHSTGNLDAAQKIMADMIASGALEKLYRAAMNYRRWNRHSEATPLLHKLLAEVSDSVRLMFIQAAGYERAGRREEAVEIFELLLELEPDHTLALNYLGYMWAEDGKNLDRALELVRRAVEIEPDNGSYLDSLGWIQFRRGRVAEARKHLEQAVLKSNDATIHDHLGDVYASLKDLKSARESYRKALELGGDNRDEVRRKLRDLE